MTTNTDTPVARTGSKPQRLYDALDVLESLAVGVIVADADGSIGYRNALATSWLPEGDDLATAFRAARMVRSFPGWPTILSAARTSESTYEGSCVIAPVGVARPLLMKLTCAPLRRKPANARESVVIHLVRQTADESVDPTLDVSQRLASLGKLATRVAHELNNPLDGILRYINLAMRAADETPHQRLKSYLSESRVGLMRMVQIIGDLLEFSRATDGEFDAMTVNDVVEQAIKSTASTAEKNHVVVTADYQHEQMPTACGSRLYQVCCNLIKNAIDVMPDGGRVSITTGLVNEHVVIRVADTGVGLPDPPQRVFEPFFTTKAPGKGTGLGLAICKDFVENLRGTIRAESGDAGGAVFTVTIPTSSFRHSSRLGPAGSAKDRPGE